MLLESAKDNIPNRRNALNALQRLAVMFIAVLGSQRRANARLDDVLPGFIALTAVTFVASSTA